MNNRKRNTLIGASLLALCVGLSLSLLAWSDEDEWGEHFGGKMQSERESEEFFSRTMPASLTSRDKTYNDECAACHFAYPPGLLPARSWERIMATLDNHFGENAELDPATRNKITEYLRSHAADQNPGRFSRSLLRSIGHDKTPLRITETPFFRYVHHEVPTHMVTGNDKVRSFSNCTACHRIADKGVFSEESVRIPGYGFWED